MKSAPLPALLLLVTPAAVHAQDANIWHKVDSAVIHGRRYETPLVYAADMKKFLVVGGRTSYADYRKVPRTFDEAALDLAKGQWENLFPDGKDWGPRFGECKAPAWKGESRHVELQPGQQCVAAAQVRQAAAAAARQLADGLRSDREEDRPVWR
jgi:hypothetical protein